MQSQELEKLIEQGYVPSEQERRKAVMMYFLIWIIISLIKGVESKYESYHLKQALGWWFVFVVVVIINVILFFVPILNILWWLVVVLMFWVWVYFVYQAIAGRYTTENDKIILPVFYWLGEWVWQLFELDSDKNLKT